MPHSIVAYRNIPHSTVLELLLQYCPVSYFCTAGSTIAIIGEGTVPRTPTVPWYSPGSSILPQYRIPHIAHTCIRCPSTAHRIAR
eukprot:2004949-Rhodomonas_salina.1